MVHTYMAICHGPYVLVFYVPMSMSYVHVYHWYCHYYCRIAILYLRHSDGQCLVWRYDGCGESLFFRARACSASRCRIVVRCRSRCDSLARRPRSNTRKLLPPFSDHHGWPVRVLPEAMPVLLGAVLHYFWQHLPHRSAVLHQHAHLLAGGGLQRSFPVHGSHGVVGESGFVS